MKINPSFLFTNHKSKWVAVSSALLANYDSGEFHITKNNYGSVDGRRCKEGEKTLGKGAVLEREPNLGNADVRPEQEVVSDENRNERKKYTLN